jgi:hypothetical protein
MDIPSIKSLKRANNIREIQEIKVFDIILNKCIEEIHRINKYSKKTYCIYTVPGIIIGHLNYNPKECVLYITKSFKKEGYKVELLSPLQIYIDWSEYNNVIHKEKDHVKKISQLFPKAKNIKYIYE